MANTEQAWLESEKSNEIGRRPWPLRKKLTMAAVVFLIAVGLALTRHHGNNGNNAGHGNRNNHLGRRSATWRPSSGTSWQIILRRPVDLGTALSPDVDVYDLDMYENPAATLKALQEKGKRVICYFSAGSYEDWRADKGEFTDADLGKPLVGWPGERWLKLSSENVRRIMSERVKYAADKGCDAIDPDNVDGYVCGSCLDIPFTWRCLG